MVPPLTTTTVRTAACSLNVNRDKAEAECQNCKNADVLESSRFILNPRFFTPTSLGMSAEWENVLLNKMHTVQGFYQESFTFYEVSLCLN